MSQSQGIMDTLLSNFLSNSQEASLTDSAVGTTEEILLTVETHLSDETLQPLPLTHHAQQAESNNAVNRQSSFGIIYRDLIPNHRSLSYGIPGVGLTSVTKKSHGSGELEFTVELPPERKGDRTASWTYSADQNKLFVRPHQGFMLVFRTKKSVPENAFVRVYARFEGVELFTKPVLRCPLHVLSSDKSGSLEESMVVEEIKPTKMARIIPSSPAPNSGRRRMGGSGRVSKPSKKVADFKSEDEDDDDGQDLDEDDFGGDDDPKGHVMKRNSISQPPKTQFVLSQNRHAIYELFHTHESVLVPLKKSPMGGTSMETFSLGCFSSCPTIMKQPVELYFSLEVDKREVGSTTLGVRVCACPVRDRKMTENPDMEKGKAKKARLAAAAAAAVSQQSSGSAEGVSHNFSSPPPPPPPVPRDLALISGDSSALVTNLADANLPSAGAGAGVDLNVYRLDVRGYKNYIILKGLADILSQQAQNNADIAMGLMPNGLTTTTTTANNTTITSIVPGDEANPSTKKRARDDDDDVESLPSSSQPTGNQSFEQWLAGLGLSEYHGAFVQHGYNNFNAMSSLGEQDFHILGISKPGHCKTLQEACRRLHPSERKSGGVSLRYSFKRTISDHTKK